MRQVNAGLVAGVGQWREVQRILGAPPPTPPWAEEPYTGGAMRGNVRQMSSIRARAASSHQSALLRGLKNAHHLLPSLVFHPSTSSLPILPRKSTLPPFRPPHKPPPPPPARLSFLHAVCLFLPRWRAPLGFASAWISSLILPVSWSAGVSSSIFTSRPPPTFFFFFFLRGLSGAVNSSGCQISLLFTWWRHSLIAACSLFDQNQGLSPPVWSEFGGTM